MEGLYMERLVFRCDRHEEIIRFVWMRQIYYHPVLLHAFCLRTIKNVPLVLIIPDATVQFNT